MKKTILAIFLLLIIGVYCNGADLTTYFAYPTELVYPEKAVNHAVSDNFTVTLLKGEVEPCQYVVQNICNEKDELSNISVEISKVNNTNWITPYFVGYTKVKENIFPDPLLPMKSSFSIPVYRKQSIWLSIKAPENAKAGIYKALITLKLNNKVIERKTLKIKVINKEFTKPYKMGVTVGCGYGDLVKPLALERHIYSDNCWNGTAKPIFNMDNNGNIKLDFTEFDKQINERIKVYGERYFTIGFIIGDAGGVFQNTGALYPEVIMPNGDKKNVSIDPEKGKEEYRLFKQVMTQYEKHLAERNWLKNSFVYLFDEPQKEELKVVVKKYSNYFKEVAPKLNILVVAGPSVENYGDKVDISCILINHCRAETSVYAKKHNITHWLYTCGDLQNTSLTIGYPAIDFRSLGWLAYRFDVDYLLHWAVDVDISKQKMINDTTYEPIPLNGDGLLFYQYENNGKLIAIPSIRSENLRDACEDAMILELASKKNKSIKDQVIKLFPDQFKRNQDSKALFDLRDIAINSL